MKTTSAIYAAFLMLTAGSVRAQTLTLPDGFPFVPAKTQSPSNGVPFVRLDKSVFASGESVFFWTGVEAINHTSIPKEYWNTCRLIITRPDGIQRTERIGWPIDGAVDLGWMGGSGLGEKPQPGRYLVAFEFAGQKSRPTPLIVEDLPVLKGIKAEFVIGPPAKLPNEADTPVTLTVHNGTNQTLRFPHRDGVNGMVSYFLTNADGKFNSSGFYPPDQLLDQDEPKAPNHTVDNFTWKDAKELPTITLRPGETYTQQLSLGAAIADANKSWRLTQVSSIPGGQYKVTFSTTLQMLIGEVGGEFAAVSPVHIPVVSTATCTVSP